MKFVKKYKYLLLIMGVVLAFIIKHFTTSYSIESETDINEENPIVDTSKYNIEISCPKVATNGEIIECELFATGNQFGGVEASITYDGLIQNNFTKEENWPYADINNGKLVAVSEIDVEGKSKIGTLDLTVSDNLNINKSITITDGKIFKITDESFVTQDNTTIINNPSTNCMLTSLSINEGTLSPAFNPNITEYTATVDASSIEISGTSSEEAKIEGTGTKELNYGENKFNVMVVAQAGNTKVYIITITRNDNRSNNNHLKTLTITGIDSKFNKDILNYEYSVENNINEIEISAAPEDTKSTISGLGKKTLNVGKNTFKIVVTSEKGTPRTYTIIINRKDIVIVPPVLASDNNYLKTLTITGINSKFNRDILNYEYSVENETNEIEIGGIPEDTKSIINGLGKKTLKVGKNTFKIVVTSEKGTPRTYTVVINKKEKVSNTPVLSNNVNIKEILINDVNISLITAQDTYSVSVKNSVSKVTIKYVLEDEKATAVIEGNENLKIGVNAFNIIVTAEDGTTKTYQILLERKANENVILNNNEQIINEIQNGKNDIVTVTLKTENPEKQIEQSVVEELMTTKKSIVYEVLNENEGLLYSVQLNSNDIINPENIDINLDFEENKTLKLNDRNVKYLNFKNNGVSKTNVSTRIFVGDKFSDGQVLTLSEYNPTNKTIKTFKTDVVVEDGFITFESDKLVTYILSASTLKVTNNIILGIILGLIVTIIILFGGSIIVTQKHKLAEGI